VLENRRWDTPGMEAREQVYLNKIRVIKRDYLRGTKLCFILLGLHARTAVSHRINVDTAFIIFCHWSNWCSTVLNTFWNIIPIAAIKADTSSGYDFHKYSSHKIIGPSWIFFILLNFYNNNILMCLQ
jgi:hypothetical protein